MRWSSSIILVCGLVLIVFVDGFVVKRAQESRTKRTTSRHDYLFHSTASNSRFSINEKKVSLFQRVYSSSEHDFSSHRYIVPSPISGKSIKVKIKEFEKDDADIHSEYRTYSHLFEDLIETRLFEENLESDLMNDLDNYILSYAIDSSQDMKHLMLYFYEIDDAMEKDCQDDQLIGIMEVCLDSSSLETEIKTSLLASIVPSPKPQRAFISNVILDLQYKGGGYTKLFMQCCENLTKVWGYNELNLGGQPKETIAEVLPLPWLKENLENGNLRSIADGLFALTAPSLTLANFSAFQKFVQLTLNRKVLQYGSHKSQFVDIFVPDNDDPRGFVMFVHGGAWGTGAPWMYRLCATPFLEAGMAVGVVGYRTYPDGNVQDQVNDLESAASCILKKYPHLVKPPNNKGSSGDGWLGVNLVAHSSGAHIASLMTIERIEKLLEKNMNQYDATTLQFDNLLCLSGVYSISNHLEFEMMRGVAQYSPLTPANGYTQESFDYYSPPKRLEALLADRNRKDVKEIMNRMLPRILFTHGVQDSEVPFTNTRQAVKQYKSLGVENIDEMYPNSDHKDVVIDLSFGGYAEKSIIDWIRSQI